MSNIQFSVQLQLHRYYSYNQFNSGCRCGCIFTARDKILARNENESEKRKQQ